VNANRLPIEEKDAAAVEPAPLEQLARSAERAEKPLQTPRKAAVAPARKVLQDWLSGKARPAARDPGKVTAKREIPPKSPVSSPPELEAVAPVEEVTIDFEDSLRADSVTARDIPHVAPVPQRTKDRRTLELKRGRPWGRGSILRTAGIGAAAILTIGALVSIFGRHAPPPAPVTAARASLPEAGTVIRDCPTCPGMTVLPMGRFQQGSVIGASSFEKPSHWVMINHPIAMSTNTVTVDEFQQFISATGRDMQGCDTYDGAWRRHPKASWKSPGFTQTGTHPVTCTSWNDAVAYAQWLSSKTGHLYRLPSASEWEYAARAGGEEVAPWTADSTRACEFGNVADESAAHRYPGWSVFACKDGFANTAPVGSFKSNEFGLNDMMGNVFQWTNDCWSASYVGAPIDGSARTDGNCADRELRGGSWFSTPAYVRASYRNHFSADYRTSSVGIRLVRDIER
jgi:formylglycine-generating enzyme required for sulfatase activity